MAGEVILKVSHSEGGIVRLDIEDVQTVFLSAKQSQRLRNLLDQMRDGEIGR